MTSSVNVDVLVQRKPGEAPPVADKDDAVEGASAAIEKTEAEPSGKVSTGPTDGADGENDGKEVKAENGDVSFACATLYRRHACSLTLVA